MEELEIQTHSFEKSKNQLKKFSEQTTTDLELKKVSSSKGLGEWFTGYFTGEGLGTNHKVTGSELNDLTTQIQNHLIDINNMHRDFIQEFGQVYNALESLDTDYIQAILIAIKASQKANAEAKIAQDDIEKTIALQKKTIKVLAQFKEKIDQYKHLVDIDSMWEKIEHSYDKMLSLDENIQELVVKINEKTQQLNLNTEFCEKLNKQQHIFDIDNMWTELNSVKNQSELINTNTENLAESMNQLELTIEKFVNEKKNLDSIIHLSDIDSMYDDTKEFKNEVNLMSETISKQNDLIVNLQNKIEDVESKSASKIKTAYFLAGGAIGLVIVEFIFIMMRNI